MTSPDLITPTALLVPPPTESMVTEAIRVCGTVQGVGFRPTVYRLAKTFALGGDVCNDGEGVLIRVTGSPVAIHQFVQQLQAECPPLARIESIARQRLTTDLPDFDTTDFTIRHSVNTHVRTAIAPDAATCPQCWADILDPASRWYHYPFTNCTHCGPRLSIVRSIPYDRAHTSMANFPMCADCRAEYEAVLNRRFHAQPIACPLCGPQVWLERSHNPAPIPPEAADPDTVLARVATLLNEGNIVAIKGIGGIHLACDATNEAAVQTLRQRKHRYHKPFALMARDVQVIEQYCHISAAERELLASSAAPIVLLEVKEKRGDGTAAIAPAVAPDIRTIGFMLPYTPLHHLLLQQCDRPIVLTSGNRSDEPQCIDNETARQSLADIADYLLLHNRDIVNRVDDSVVQVLPASGQRQILRRARGYAPAPIRLPAGFEQAPPLLAMGSELKNTFGLLRDGQAILSQHLGDLENTAAFAAYQQTLNLYLHLFEHQPQAIAVDYHPEYLSTKLGQELAHTNTLPLHAIQHHHAHVAACMVENDLPLTTPPILGIALDGLGYGEDGNLWGGEFLRCDYRHYQRLASLRPVAMVGGAQAIYQPWRNTVAHLLSAFGQAGSGDRPNPWWDILQQEYGSLELVEFLRRQPLPLLQQLITKGINSPPASSTGRLFDAVAAALGIWREHCSYEGQAAIALETQATQFLITPDAVQSAKSFAYPFAIASSHDLPLLDPTPLWRALLHDLQQNIPIPAMAARFHYGLAGAIVSMVSHLHDQQPFTQVALTGGVLQNQLLQKLLSQQLTSLGFTVLTHSRVPANDGGLALGQLAIAAARTLSPT